MENNKKYIRFINSHYTDLFSIEDGKNVLISYPDGEKKKLACQYLDEYHTRIGHNVYHICQFAEVMERIGAKYEPEEYITDKGFYEKRYLDRERKDENGKPYPFYKIEENEKWLFGFCPEGKDHQVCLVDKKDRFQIYFGESLDELSELLERSGLNVKMIAEVVKGMKENHSSKMSLEEKIKAASKNSDHDTGSKISQKEVSGISL